MDNRDLCRAHIRKLGWIMDVVRINFDAETVELDFKDNADLWEYGFDEIDLLHCTGLSAQKSYRGTEPEDLLVWEGDVLDCGDRIVRVSWNEQHGTWDSTFVRYTDRSLSSNGITPVEWKFRAEIISTIHDGGGE